MPQYRPKPPKSAAQRRRMSAVTASLGTKAKKIKALHDHGYSRSAIAGFLGIGYQHVSNVLGAARPKARPKRQGVAEVKTVYDADPSEFFPSGVFEIDAEGRIALPQALLKAIDGMPEGRVPWRFESGELILMSIDAARRSLDELTRELRKRPGSMVDDLIAERRAEFELEEKEFSGKSADE